MDGLTREEWVAARVSEFKTDPATRDRAIAYLLHDSLILNHYLGELTSRVRQEGLGGVLKALMGAMRNGR